MPKFTQSDLRKIAHLTDVNANTEARIFIARKINSPTLPKYKRNLDMHLKKGELTPALSNERRELDIKLFRELKRKVTDEEYLAVERSL